MISDPVTGGIPGPRLSEAHTAVRIDAYVTAATSATFNIEERSAIGTAGDNIVAADLAAGTGGVSSTSPTNSSLASGSWLWIDISAVAGTPNQLVITLACTV